MRPVEVDGVISRLDILDTAGQDEFAALFSQWVKNRHGFMLVYSVDNRKTFENVLEVHELLQQYLVDEHCPILLVANKVDLPKDTHKVTPEEGEDLARKLEVDRFIETSALTGLNIDECFFSMVRMMRDYQKAKNPEKKDSQGSEKKPRHKGCSIL
jgi:small GTP-binding protein